MRKYIYEYVSLAKWGESISWNLQNYYTKIRSMYVFYAS